MEEGLNLVKCVFYDQ